MHKATIFEIIFVGISLQFVISEAVEKKYKISA